MGYLAKHELLELCLFLKGLDAIMDCVVYENNQVYPFAEQVCLPDSELKGFLLLVAHE